MSDALWPFETVPDAKLFARNAKQVRKAALEIAGDLAAQADAVCHAVGYLAGLDKPHAAAALALAWPRLFPEIPAPPRIHELLGVEDADLFGGDYG